MCCRSATFFEFYGHADERSESAITTQQQGKKKSHVRVEMVSHVTMEMGALCGVLNGILTQGKRTIGKEKSSVEERRAARGWTAIPDEHSRPNGSFGCGVKR